MGVWCAERGGWASCLALTPPHRFSPCRKYAEFKDKVVKAVLYMSKAFHCLVWCDCPLTCTFCKESNNVVVLNFYHHLWEFLLLFHDEKTSCQVFRHRWASLCQFTSSILTLPEGAGCFLSSSTAWPVLLEHHQHMKYTQSACWAESTDCTICMTFDLIKPCPSCSFIPLQCLQPSRASMRMLYLCSQPRLHFSIACAKSKTDTISFKNHFIGCPWKKL